MLSKFAADAIILTFKEQARYSYMNQMRAQMLYNLGLVILDYLRRLPVESVILLFRSGPEAICNAIQHF